MYTMFMGRLRLNDLVYDSNYMLPEATILSMGRNAPRYFVCDDKPCGLACRKWRNPRRKLWSVMYVAAHREHAMGLGTNASTDASLLHSRPVQIAPRRVSVLARFDLSGYADGNVGFVRLLDGLLRGTVDLVVWCTRKR